MENRRDSENRKPLYKVLSLNNSRSVKREFGNQRKEVIK